jgi:hypothetical protein
MSSAAAGPEPDLPNPDPGVSRRPLEDFLGRTVAVATIVGFIAQGFGAGLHTTAIVFVLTFVAAYPIHRYLKRSSRLRGRLKSAPISAPMLVAVALACILGGMLIRQHYMISPSGVDVGEITDAFHWKLRWCRHDELCKAAAISSLPQELTPKDSLPGDLLFSDQVLGEILRSSPESMKLLRKYYGVKEAGFLGTGLSKPLDQQTFVAARIPEYLVPNYSDAHEGVLVWKLEPILKYANENLYDTLNSTTPINVTEWHKRQLQEILNKRLSWNAKAPAVVRFALIPREKYSGCLGRIEAHEVFASHLGLIKSYGLTVEEATRMSGYPLSMGANDELYVFVFVPTHDEELNVPTWTHMVSNLRGEMDKLSPCLEGAVRR